jgi:hypothetical protein
MAKKEALRRHQLAKALSDPHDARTLRDIRSAIVLFQKIAT